jgi:hypothetical protein
MIPHDTGSGDLALERRMTMADDREPIEQVQSRSAVVGTVSMWGKLYVHKLNRKVVGWIVDTWTEVGIEPRLHPKMHWVSRTDGKIHHMSIAGNYGAAIADLGEDTEVEPNRAAIIETNLARWEQEWLEQQNKKF